MPKCRLSVWVGLQMFGFVSLSAYLAVTYNASTGRRGKGRFSQLYSVGLKRGMENSTLSSPAGEDDHSRKNCTNGNFAIPKVFGNPAVRNQTFQGRYAVRHNTSQSFIGQRLESHQPSTQLRPTTKSSRKSKTGTADFLFRMVNASSSDSTDYPDLSSFEIPRLSHPHLPRALNETEYQNVRELLSELDRIFTENNITYVLSQGSLLGSYLVHDILPWDDDLDLFVKESDKAKLWCLFNKTQHYDHIAAFDYTKHPSQMVKLFYKHSPHAGSYPWKWPFADVVFYRENSRHVWSMEGGGLELKLKRDSFYPLHRRPYAGLWLASPKDPQTFLRKKYRTFVCKSHMWNHRREMWSPSKSTSCQSLKKYYPMVYRSAEGFGVRETLKFGKEVLYSVHVDEPYRGQVHPFEL